jgi:hypothetical protein
MIKNNKKFLYFCMFNTVVLSNFFSVRAMEIIDIKKDDSIVIDWDYKKRDDQSFCCFKDRTTECYPYFLRSQADGKRVSYEQLATKYKEKFNNDYDIGSLSTQDKKTLWYVLEMMDKQKELRIEGRDEKFARSMSHRIVGLPIEIRRAIAEKTSQKMKSNNYYVSSFLDTLVDDELNKEKFSFMTATGGYGCSLLLEHGFLWCCGFTEISVLCCGLLTALSWGVGVGCYKKTKDNLQEAFEKKDKRHGFVVIDLLEDMPWTIVDVDGKEKQD